MARQRKIQEPQIPGAEPQSQEAEQVQEQASEVDGLPSAADIDPTTISRPVLCKEGWVCPA